MRRTRIDRAGRVLIPKPIRDQLGLAAGAELEIFERDGKIIIERLPGEVQLVRSGRGMVAVDATGTMPRLTMVETRRTRDEVRSTSS
jgi:AbrB family looped-hinge helix DNA binding protein